MNYLIFSYEGSSRDLRKIIVSLLKLGLVDNIKKINYAQDYSVVGEKIEKKEEKLILIYSQNQDNLLSFLGDKFPELKNLSIN